MCSSFVSCGGGSVTGSGFGGHGGGGCASPTPAQAADGGLLDDVTEKLGELDEVLQDVHGTAIKSAGCVEEARRSVADLRQEARGLAAEVRKGFMALERHRAERSCTPRSNNDPPSGAAIVSSFTGGGKRKPPAGAPAGAPAPAAAEDLVTPLGGDALLEAQPTLLEDASPAPAPAMAR
jgi:hypothetical protein